MASQKKVNKTLGRGGTKLLLQEKKDLRKKFVPIDENDHLAVYLDGQKFDPVSWDRFGDSNVRKGKGGAAFNLTWIKNGGAKIDQLAQSVRQEVPGHANLDDDDIILLITDLVSLYPYGMTEYYYDSMSNKDAEANYYNMKHNGKNGQEDDEFISSLSKSEYAKVMNIKTAKRKAATAKKASLSPELLLIKKVNELRNKKVTTLTLKSIVAKTKTLLANKNCGHKALIKSIQIKFAPVVESLTKNKVAAINKLIYGDEFFTQLEKPLHNPKVKTVELAGADSKSKHKYKVGDHVLVKVHPSDKRLWHYGKIKALVTSGSANQLFYRITGFGDEVEEGIVSLSKRKTLKGATASKKKQLTIVGNFNAF